MDVQIKYKSGKVEIADISLRDYVAALESLTIEGRLVEIKILPTRLDWVTGANQLETRGKS